MKKSLAFIAAATATVAMSPAVFAYNNQKTVTLNFDESLGTVTSSIEKHDHHNNKVTLTITPKADYACDDVNVTYKNKGTNKTISGVSCENLTFEFPDSNVNKVTVNVDFALENYTLTSENSNWTIGSEDGLTFTGNGAYADFYQVTVDNNILGAGNYEVAEGSTVVTLTPAYLATLAIGEHNISMVWNNGENSASSTFRVMEAQSQDEPVVSEEPTTEEEVKTPAVAPNTGAASSVVLYFAAAALILGGAFVAAKAKSEA